MSLYKKRKEAVSSIIDLYKSMGYSQKTARELAEAGIDFLTMLGERGKKPSYEMVISELRSATKANDLIEIISSATGDPGFKNMLALLKIYLNLSKRIRGK